MMGLLFSLPAQLKKLSDRLSPTRATKLDNANVPVSSLAPQSVALSDAVWTTARANNLNAPVSGIATQASANGVNGDLAAAETNIDAPLSSLPGSILGARKIQSGIVDMFGEHATGNGLEFFHWKDIPITPVSNIANCLVFIRGGVEVKYETFTHIKPRIIRYEANLISKSTIRIHYRTFKSSNAAFGGRSMFAQWIVMELT